MPNQAFVPLSRASCASTPPSTPRSSSTSTATSGPRPATSSGFVPVAPTRLYDTRQADIATLEPGVPRSITVEGVPAGAPANANAVAVNLTVVAPSDYGFIRAYPCDQTGTSEVSNVNFEPLENRANSAIVPTVGRRHDLRRLERRHRPARRHRRLLRRRQRLPVHAARRRCVCSTPARPTPSSTRHRRRARSRPARSCSFTRRRHPRGADQRQGGVGEHHRRRRRRLRLRDRLPVRRPCPPCRT